MRNGLILLLMKKGMPRTSPRFDACTYWIYLGVTWASQILSFCPYFLSYHHSSPPTLENSLHTKLHTIVITKVSAIKIIYPIRFSFKSSLTPIKTLATVTTSFKKNLFKRTPKEKIKRQRKCWQKSVKTEQ